MSDTTPLSLYVVFGSATEAQRIARQMVEERLAACVNILAPCHSVYRWEGKVEEGEEVPALFKTHRGIVEELMARIATLHSYATPAMAAWEVAVLPDSCRNWLLDNTR